METLAIIKPDGAIQRKDVALSERVATTLVERIMQGLPVYVDEGIDIELEGGVIQHISSSQLSQWVVRSNVIPETGRTLREVLDEARIEKKRQERELRQQEIISNAEISLAEIVRLPIVTTTTRRSYGFDKETGRKFQRGESHETGVDAKLADVKAKGLMFALERLDAPKYGAKTSSQNTHLVFSLSDLRKAKASRDEQLAEQVQ